MILKELMLMERTEFSANELKAIAKKVYEMAEAEAFEEVSEAKGAVTGDMIHTYARSIVAALPKRIMSHIDDLIEAEHT